MEQNVPHDRPHKDHYGREKRDGGQRSQVGKGSAEGVSLGGGGIPDPCVEHMAEGDVTVTDSIRSM